MEKAIERMLEEENRKNRIPAVFFVSEKMIDPETWQYWERYHEKVNDPLCNDELVEPELYEELIEFQKQMKQRHPELLRGKPPHGVPRLSKIPPLKIEMKEG
eukprot:Nk52_evm1s2104 gene=Nk52_evmTU1s2104